jgi:hypothetical protein
MPDEQAVIIYAGRLFRLIKNIFPEFRWEEMQRNWREKLNASDNRPDSIRILRPTKSQGHKEYRH